MEKEEVLKSLNNVRKILKKKYRDLQRYSIDESMMREQTFEPITKPLKTLVDRSEQGKGNYTNPFLIDTEYDTKFQCSTPHPLLNPLKSSKSVKIESPIIHEDESNNSVASKIPETMEEEYFEANPSDTTPITLKRGYTTLFQERTGEIAGKYISLLFGSDKDNIDSVFGFKNLRDKGLAIGREPVRIADNDLYIGNQIYTGTPGLYELITLRRPKNYTNCDLNTYKRILEQTKAHLTIHNKIKSSTGYKYNTIIKKLFSGQQSQTTKSGGSYQYWDDPNELVGRLRLLLSSTVAGNTNHNNEILDIIDELREAEIIY